MLKNYRKLMTDRESISAVIDYPLSIHMHIRAILNRLSSHTHTHTLVTIIINFEIILRTEENVNKLFSSPLSEVSVNTLFLSQYLQACRPCILNVIVKVAFLFHTHPIPPG